MKTVYEKYGTWALITGASSGIGKEFAKQLAELGFNLILVARRKEKLEELTNELITKHAVTILPIALDLTKDDFLEELISKTNHLEIGLLINNAGFAITGNFLDQKIEKEVELLNLNCKAPIELSHYYGNKMVERNRGGIINIASGVAFLPVPFWSTYAASKAFILSFSESLSYELKPKGVDVLALCPGATKTEFSEVANLKSMGMAAKDVVKIGLQNLGVKTTQIAGKKNQFTTFLLRFFSRKLLLKIGAKIVPSMK